MILYLDTSALVKLYLDEAGSEAVRRAVADYDTRATSAIAYVEAKSALSRKFRMKELREHDYQKHKDEFERNWGNFASTDVDRSIIRRGGELVESFVLKAYDAIHLASAESVRRASQLGVTFACFDSSLSRAAATLGFVLLK